MEYDYKILEEKFNQLPEEVQLALTSTSVTEKIKSIGKRYGLKIDQESVLFDLTSHVMLGLVPSKDFVKTLTKEASLDESLSAKVAVDINKEIFDEIKSFIRNNSETSPLDANSENTTPDSDISSIELAGGFEIEKEPGEAVSAVGIGKSYGASMTSTPATPIAPAPTPTTPVPPSTPQPPADLPTDDPYREGVK